MGCDEDATAGPAGEPGATWAGPGEVTRRAGRHSTAKLGAALLALALAAGAPALGAATPAVAAARATPGPTVAHDTTAPLRRLETRSSRTRSPRRFPRPVLRLTVVDPAFSGGYQVGDALTVTARVARGRVRPHGTVSFSTDERYDRGCKPERLSRSLAVCYVTFYIPGRHRISARFVASDHAVAKVSISLDLVPPTGS